MIDKKKVTLLFDLDNTLFYSSEVYKKSLPPGVTQSSFLMAREATKELLPAGHVAARNRLIYFKNYLVRRGNYSPKVCLDLMRQYEMALARNIKKDWARLNRQHLFRNLIRNYSIAVITNENLRTQMIKMNAIDPDGQIFKIIVTSEEVGVEKPQKKIFDCALKILRTSPQSCYFIGDDFKSDIVGAKKVGMTPIHTLEFSKDKRKRPGVLTIDQLDELPALLERL